MRYCERRSGLKNSSSRTSPGWIGGCARRAVVRFLVVVADLDVIRVSVFPAEANSPLIVDSDAVLARAVSRESFQSIPRWHPKVVQPFNGVQEQQLSVRPSLHVRSELTSTLPLEHLSRLSVPKRPNHRSNVTGGTSNVNRYYDTTRCAQPNKRLKLTSSAETQRNSVPSRVGARGGPAGGQRAHSLSAIRWAAWW